MSNAHLSNLTRRFGDALRHGTCPPDEGFDGYLPFDLRRVATVHWSRVEVGLRAGRWFDQFGVKRVVDVGSGSGKFCIVAALASSATFLGVEQRPRLVEVARQLATDFGVGERARFVNATFGNAPVPVADAYYFFNPFGENRFPPDERLDADVELNVSRYWRDVHLAETFLHALPSGTFVLTYNGFGGLMPASFMTLRVDSGLPSILRLWRKE